MEISDADVGIFIRPKFYYIKKKSGEIKMRLKGISPGSKVVPEDVVAKFRDVKNGFKRIIPTNISDYNAEKDLLYELYYSGGFPTV